MNYDYFYGGQSESFSFYRIPRQLVTGAEFRHLSTDAKLLYGMMLDRMGLSARNGWYDDIDRVYIYYTVEEIMEDLCCGHNKAVRLLAELDTVKGVGLIEQKSRVRENRLSFMSGNLLKPRTGGNLRRQDFLKWEVQKRQKRKPRLPETTLQDFPKAEVQTAQKGKQIILIKATTKIVILIHLSIHRMRERSRKACGSR